jgi:hypothetical protein
LVFANEEYGIGALDALTDSLGKADELIGIRARPDVVVSVAFDKLAVLELFSCGRVNDSLGHVRDPEVIVWDDGWLGARVGVYGAHKICNGAGSGSTGVLIVFCCVGSGWIPVVD